MEKWREELVNGNRVVFFRYDTQYGENEGIEYLATKNPNGTFDVSTHLGCFKEVPQGGIYDSWLESDEAQPRSVCWIEGGWVFIYPVGYRKTIEYIQLDEPDPNEEGEWR